MGLWSRVKGLFKKPEEINGIVLLLTEPRLLEPQRIESVLQAIGSPAPCVFANEHWLAIPDLRIAILQVPSPYVPPGMAQERLAGQIRELRLKDAFLSHKAFVSLHVAPDTTPEASLVARQIICRMTANLVDETTAVLWDTASNRMVLPTQDVLESLETGSDSGFADISWDAVTGADHHDARVLKAIAETQDRFPEFRAAFEAGGLEVALAKAPFKDRNGENEHMWFEVTEILAHKIRGNLVNQPRNVAGLSEGSPVEVSIYELTDWLYGNEEGGEGGFLERVLRDG